MNSSLIVLSCGPTRGRPSYTGGSLSPAQNLWHAKSRVASEIRSEATRLLALPVFSFSTCLEAQPQAHRDSAAAAVVLLEVEERSPGGIERDGVRNAEVRVVESVEHLEPIPQLESLGDA